MLILRLACDNMYMFRNFSLDLTYQRKIHHPLAEHDTLFPGSRIKVRKSIIIMGANSSGKTTFGKLLRFILNYIRGERLDAAPEIFGGIPYDKSAKSNFEIEFVIGHTAYLLKAVFKEEKLCWERLSSCKIQKSYNIAKLRTLLNSEENIQMMYPSESELMDVGLASYVFTRGFSADILYVKMNIGYLLCFSEYTSNSVANRAVDLPLLNDILPHIDTSVSGVEKLSGEKRTKTKSYLIKFKNGETLTVPDGELDRCGERLSHGTFEAIRFISVFSELSHRDDIFFIDEQLTHMNSELEAYFIRKTFLKKLPDAQVFFTTHNIEIFELNVPNHAFIFFRRGIDGMNEAMLPSDMLNKNDRNLRNYYENDFFGVMPDYSIMDKFFEISKDEEEKDA